MRGSREESLETLVIPENFVDTGRCFNGMFRTRNLLEGVVFAASPAYLIIHSALPIEQKIIVGVVTVGIILTLFINGVNGDSFLEFLANWAFFRKKKRVAKYNPRVKREATPGYLTSDQFELPRDKIMRIYREFMSRENTDEEAVSRDIYDPMYIEFVEDELGYLETPDDLKSKKELREEARQRRKIEREKQKAEKQAAQEEKNKKRRGISDDKKRKKRSSEN